MFSHYLNTTQHYLVERWGRSQNTRVKGQPSAPLLLCMALGRAVTGAVTSWRSWQADPAHAQTGGYSLGTCLQNLWTPLVIVMDNPEYFSSRNLPD
jgi:hypothetical protein